MKNGIYKHYKDKLYEVFGTTIHSETLEKYVLYKALYKSEGYPMGQLWVRPYNMFNESVIIDGKEVPRFKYMGDDYKVD